MISHVPHFDLMISVKFFELTQYHLCLPQVVVILVIWVISLLVVYMSFLLCLDPLLNKRRSQPSYQEHTNEYDETSSVGGAPGMSQRMHVRANVLGRVGHQQDKWKRQVQEQRYNIYDKHTMLN